MNVNLAKQVDRPYEKACKLITEGEGERDGERQREKETGQPREGEGEGETDRQSVT